MWTDPVVDEIHKIREKMLAEVGGDTAKLMAKIRENQATGGRVIVGPLLRPLWNRLATIRSQTSV